MTNANKQLGVFFPGALGDFVCFLPALDQLRSRGSVKLFARTEYVDLVGPEVAISSLERYEVRRLFAPAAHCDARVRAFFGGFSEVHSWTGSQAPLFVVQLQQATGGRGRCYPFTPPPDQGAVTHQADYYRSCLGLGHDAATQPKLPAAAAAQDWCESLCQHYRLNARPLLVLAPGSGALEKNWPAAYFAQVAAWWCNEIGGVVTTLVGPVEQERGKLDRILDHSHLLREISLAQCAEVIRRATLFVGNDSGISHLAAATGTRSVVLFGPTDPSRWCPRGPHVTAIARDLSCSPCAPTTMKQCRHRDCLSGLAPQELIAQIARLPEVINLTRLGAGIRV